MERQELFAINGEGYEIFLTKAGKPVAKKSLHVGKLKICLTM